jgi:hypothetical protein
VLTRQPLYYLSHGSSLFHSDYFGDSVSLFAQADLNGDPPILYFWLLQVVARMTTWAKGTQLFFH